MGPPRWNTQNKQSMKLLDTQKYSECQLVALINAATYLGEPAVDPDSEEYERLVDLVRARCGSAINTSHAVDYLRLVEQKISPITLDNVRAKVMEGRPVAIVIWNLVVGFHAVLLTDGTARGVRAWNMRRKGFPYDRVSWNRLGELMSAVPFHCRWVNWYELDPLRKRDKKKA